MYRRQLWFCIAQLVQGLYTAELLSFIRYKPWPVPNHSTELLDPSPFRWKKEGWSLVGWRNLRIAYCLTQNQPNVIWFKCCQGEWYVVENFSNWCMCFYLLLRVICNIRLSSLRILGDWTNGLESVALDNVLITNLQGTYTSQVDADFRYKYCWFHWNRIGFLLCCCVRLYFFVFFFLFWFTLFWLIVCCTFFCFSANSSLCHDQTRCLNLR